jgi:peptidyl-prolyl cis-trans isomerase D
MHRLSFVLALLVACGTAKPGGLGGPSMNNKISNDPAVGERSPVVSWDILDREPVANSAEVKHILIGWKDLADSYGGRLDPRAAKRDRAAAEADVRSLLGQLKAGADFDTVMKANSEDEGSASSGRPYTVSPDAQLVIEFRQLGLRLKIGELGVVQSDYGFHIIKRLN